jgi:hypothetical protein
VAVSRVLRTGIPETDDEDALAPLAAFSIRAAEQRQELLALGVA